MDYSKTGIALTEQFEGCRLVAYQDSTGRWTLGFGHTSGVQPGDTCTPDQAEAMLFADIAWAVSFVNSVVTVTLTQGEFDSCCDFVFNLGSGNFKSSTLLKLINQNDMTDAVNEFEKWDKAGGVVVAGLLRRRLAEAQEFQS